MPRQCRAGETAQFNHYQAWNYCRMSKYNLNIEILLCSSDFCRLNLLADKIGRRLYASMSSSLDISCTISPERLIIQKYECSQAATRFSNFRPLASIWNFRAAVRSFLKHSETNRSFCTGCSDKLIFHRVLSSQLL